MFGFGRKKKQEAPVVGTASTFVEATGGGWSDVPDRIAADGGAQADYVGQMLERARAYALEHNFAIGQEFKFTITDIPVGIVSPHEIVLGLTMRAWDYGMSVGSVFNETATFARVE